MRDGRPALISRLLDFIDQEGHGFELSLIVALVLLVAVVGMWTLLS